MIKLKSLLENTDPLGTRLDSSEVYTDIQNLHDSNELQDEDDADENGWEEGSIGERVFEFPYFELREIPMTDIDFEEFNIDDDKVEKFIEWYKKNKEYPLIVFNPYTKSIIDGIHRAMALNKLGLKKIKAWCGVK
jgi:hypothetical protein